MSNLAWLNPALFIPAPFAKTFPAARRKTWQSIPKTFFVAWLVWLAHALPQRTHLSGADIISSRIGVWPDKHSPVTLGLNLFLPILIRMFSGFSRSLCIFGLPALVVAIASVLVQPFERLLAIDAPSCAHAIPLRARRLASQKLIFGFLRLIVFANCTTLFTDAWFAGRST